MDPTAPIFPRVSLIFVDESQLVADENNVWFENTLYGTKPVVIHGNGPSKVIHKLHQQQAAKVNLNDTIRFDISGEGLVFVGN